MRIREATLSDHPLLYAIRNSAEAALRFAPDEETWVWDTLCRPNVEVIVAEWDGQLNGFAAFLPEGDVLHLAVRAELIEKHAFAVADALSSHIEARLRGRGVTRVRLRLDCQDRLSTHFERQGYARREVTAPQWLPVDAHFERICMPDFWSSGWSVQLGDYR